MVVSLAATLTAGTNTGLTVMVIPEEVILPMLAQFELPVIWQEITSPFTNKVEV
jgi:hypothetical protein